MSWGKDSGKERTRQRKEKGKCIILFNLFLLFTNLYFLFFILIGITGGNLSEWVHKR
jgi:hypothetical protein